MAIEAYCVKCKAKKIMQDPVESTTKNGKPITKGKCPDCGTTICRIGAAKNPWTYHGPRASVRGPWCILTGSRPWMFHVKHFPSACC